MTIHTTTVRPGSGIAEGNFVVECSCGAKINVGGSRDFAEDSAIRHIAREEAAELQAEKPAIHPTCNHTDSISYGDGICDECWDDWRDIRDFS